MSEIKKFSTLLTNFRYKRNDKKIYFRIYNGVQLIENNKKVLIIDAPIGNIPLTKELILFDIKIKYNILEIENKDGLMINIEYSNNKFIYDEQINKIKDFIEIQILYPDISHISDISDILLNIRDFTNKDTFYAKQPIIDSDSTSEHSSILLLNNSEDTNSDSFNYEQREYFDNNEEEDYYENDYDYDDPEF
jgi:hypothetical protein